MQYSHEVEKMVCVAKGPNHGPAPIQKWFVLQKDQITDLRLSPKKANGCKPKKSRTLAV